MRKTVTQLADGRELIYFDHAGEPQREVVDRRRLEPTEIESEVRYDAVMDEWVVIASHRQDRTYLPPTDLCPLCPSRDGRLTEIPASDYEVVVFENRFPSLTSHSGHYPEGPDPLAARRPGLGRCEVVCFSADHDAALSRLDLR